MVKRVIIVVPEAEEKATRDLITNLAVDGWEHSIHLTSGPVQRGRGPTARRQAEKILRLSDDLDANSLIVTKEICCEHKLLESRTELDLRWPCVGLLRRRLLKEILDANGLRWRRILQDRLAQWDSKKSDVDDWLRQFESFGIKWVGETLLRQVDVIGSDELKGAFDFSAQAKLGTNLVFTFVEDTDPASSSNRIGALLTRMHGPVCDFIEALRAAPFGSRLVVCEDGLWTGAEMRKLFERLSPDGDLHSYVHGKRILFRHCVVSDYGLWVCRHFLEHSELDMVELSLGEQQRFIRVLDSESDEQTIRSQWTLSPKEFDEWLSGHVEPLVFQNVKLWQWHHGEAQDICERIGAQLIEGYVARNPRCWSRTVQKGFAIGAGRFGCTLVFAHSIPKVCLPLFWLGGTVNIKGISIEWKPLFYDARRTPISA